MNKVLFVTLALPMVLGGGLSYAGSAEAQLRVSVQAVESLAFEVLKEPHYYKVSSKMSRRSQHEDKGQDDSESDDRHHHHQSYTRDSKVTKHVRILVTTNSKNGYALMIQSSSSSVYLSARIRLKGHNDIHLQPGESMQVVVGRIIGYTDLKELEVTLHIAHKANPGKYVWPINVSAIAL